MKWAKLQGYFSKTKVVDEEKFKNCREHREGNSYEEILKAQARVTASTHKLGRERKFILEGGPF